MQFSNFNKLAFGDKSSIVKGLGDIKNALTERAQAIIQQMRQTAFKK